MGGLGLSIRQQKPRARRRGSPAAASLPVGALRSRRGQLRAAPVRGSYRPGLALLRGLRDTGSASTRASEARSQCFSCRHLTERLWPSPAPCAHLDIHLQTAHSTTTAPWVFPSSLSLRTNRGKQPHGPASLWQQTPSWARSSPAGTKATTPRPSPRPRACPAPRADRAPARPTRERWERRTAPSEPPEASCRGQRLPAFRSRPGGILTKDFKSIPGLNILPVSTSAVTKHFFFLSLCFETIDKII